MRTPGNVFSFLVVLGSMYFFSSDLKSQERPGNSEDSQAVPNLITSMDNWYPMVCSTGKSLRKEPCWTFTWESTEKVMQDAGKIEPKGSKEDLG